MDKGYTYTILVKPDVTVKRMTWHNLVLNIIWVSNILIWPQNPGVIVQQAKIHQIKAGAHKNI